MGEMSKMEEARQTTAKVDLVLEQLADLNRRVSSVAQNVRETSASQKPPGPDPRVDDLMREMKNIRDELHLVQQKIEKKSENGIFTLLVLFALILGGSFLSGVFIRSPIADQLDNVQALIIEGIYTKKTPESPSHSAIEWSLSWQNEKERRKKEAAAAQPEQ